jgi:hypothetical protein
MMSDTTYLNRIHDAIAQGQMRPQWTRAELQQYANVGRTRSYELIRSWVKLGWIEKIPGATPDTYQFVMSHTAPVPPQSSVSSTAQTVGQSASAPVRTAFMWLSDEFVRWGALVGALSIALLWSILGEYAPQPVPPAQPPTIPPTATPALLASFPTITPVPSAPVRTIPAYYAPDGEYARDVSVGGLADRVQARYGSEWAQADGLWFRVGDLAGLRLGTLADLQPPVPTPTARVVVREVLVVAPAQPVVQPTAVPTAAPRYQEPAAMVGESRAVEGGAYSLVCHPRWGCFCTTDTIPDGYAVALAKISLPVCEAERGR